MGRGPSISDADGQHPATLRSLLSISAYATEHRCGLPQPAGYSRRSSSQPVAQLMKGNWFSAATGSAIAPAWATSPSLASQLHQALIARGEYRNHPLTIRTEEMGRHRFWTREAA